MIYDLAIGVEHPRGKLFEGVGKYIWATSHTPACLYEGVRMESRRHKRETFRSLGFE